MAVLPYTPPRGEDPASVRGSEDSKYMMGLLMQMLLANQQNQLTRESMNVQQQIAAGNVQGALEQVKLANKGALETQKLSNEGRIAEQREVGAQNRQTQAAAAEQQKALQALQTEGALKIARQAAKTAAIERFQNNIIAEINRTGLDADSVVETSGEQMFSQITARYNANQMTAQGIRQGLSSSKTNADMADFLQKQVEKTQAQVDRLTTALQMGGGMGAASGGSDALDIKKLLSSDPNDIAATLMGTGVKVSMETDIPAITKALAMENGNGKLSFNDLVDEKKKIGDAGIVQNAAFLDSLADVLEAKAGTRAPTNDYQALKNLRDKPVGSAMSTLAPDTMGVAKKLRGAAAKLREVNGGDLVATHQQALQNYQRAMTPTNGKPFNEQEITNGVWNYPETAKQATDYWDMMSKENPEFSKRIPKDAFVQRVIGAQPSLDLLESASQAETENSGIMNEMPSVIADWANARMDLRERARLARFGTNLVFLEGAQAGMEGEVPPAYLHQGHAIMSEYSGKGFPELPAIAQRLHEITVKSAEAAAQKAQDAQRQIMDNIAQSAIQDRTRQQADIMKETAPSKPAKSPTSQPGGPSNGPKLAPVSQSGFQQPQQQPNVPMPNGGG